MEENTQVNGEQSSGSAAGTTGNQTPPASPTGNEGNAKNQAAGSSLTGTDTDNQAGNDTTQRNVEAEKGKMSALEKKANDLERTNSELSGVAESYRQIEATFKGNKKAYDAFRDAYKIDRGHDLGEYETRFNVAPATAPSQPQTPPVQSPQAPIGQAQQPVTAPPLNNQQRPMTADDVMYINDVRTAETKFFEEVPDMKPDKANDDLATTNRKRDMYYRVRNIVANSGGTPDAAAYTAAYNAQPENREAYRKSLIEQGKMTGQANALATGAATSGGASGSATGTSQNSNTLTDEEKYIAKVTGITEEEYLEDKNK